MLVVEGRQELRQDPILRSTWKPMGFWALTNGAGPAPASLLRPVRDIPPSLDHERPARWPSPAQPPVRRNGIHSAASRCLGVRI